MTPNPALSSSARASILAHVSKTERKTVEDETTLVLSYRSVGPDVVSVKQLSFGRRSMSNIETIFADHNGLKSFAPTDVDSVRGVDRFVRVNELYLDQNKIGPSVDGGNAFFSNLQVLSLTSNRISSIINFQKFKRLSVLKLGNNRITDLSFLRSGPCSHTLQTLVLSHNRIAFLHDIAELVNAPKLATLDLRCNPIGSDSEVLYFALTCCPELSSFNGESITNDDRSAAAKWNGSGTNGNGLNKVVSVLTRMDTWQARMESACRSTVERSNLIAELSNITSEIGVVMSIEEILRAGRRVRLEPCSGVSPGDELLEEKMRRLAAFEDKLSTEYKIDRKEVERQRLARIEAQRKEKEIIEGQKLAERHRKETEEKAARDRMEEEQKKRSKEAAIAAADVANKQKAAQAATTKPKSEIAVNNDNDNDDANLEEYIQREPVAVNPNSNASPSKESADLSLGHSFRDYKISSRIGRIRGIRDDRTRGRKKNEPYKPEPMDIESKVRSIYIHHLTEEASANS